MPTVALSGNDAVVINQRIFADLADQNAVELTFPNDIAAVKTGKNGNSLYALNETGRQAECKIRLIRGSADDKFMMGLLNGQLNNFSGTILYTGSFVKKVGDGKGNITSDTYNLSGGIITKQVEAKMNVEGDTEQSVAIYTLKFSNAPRALT